MTAPHLQKLAAIAGQLKDIHQEIDTIAAMERAEFKTDGAAKERATVVEALDDAAASLDEAIQHIEEARQ